MNKNLRQSIHFIVKILNRLLGYRIWSKGKEPIIK